jgi:hypothetical protein
VRKNVAGENRGVSVFPCDVFSHCLTASLLTTKILPSQAVRRGCTWGLPLQQSAEIPQELPPFSDRKSIGSDAFFECRIDFLIFHEERSKR